MQIIEPGYVTKRILLLGRRESCLYLLDGGEESVVLGGGMAYIAPDVEEQLQRFSVEEKKIKRVIVLRFHRHRGGRDSLRKGIRSLAAR